MLIVDSNGVRSTMALLVLRDHHRNTKLVESLPWQTNADVATKKNLQAPIP
jgi:hypothetical protein